MIAYNDCSFESVDGGYLLKAKPASDMVVDALSHMWEGGGRIRFGVYACSPEESSFKAVFTNMRITECAWKAHDGQQPD